MSKIRVLIVDDSVVIRKLITDALARDAELEVAGVAAHGKIALQKIPQVNPDIITLDLEMPEMDGLATLREVRKIYPKLPVIMFSTVTRRGAEVTLEALSRGANDYVTKPANVGGVAEGMERLQQDLIPRIKALCKRANGHSVPSMQPKLDVSARTFHSIAPSEPGPIEMVCIGTSTGGPNALATVFSGLARNFPVPIVIVQHMPPVFTAMLAQRLTAHSSVPSHEGTDGQVVESGHAYIAPGGHHMVIQRSGNHAVLKLNDEPPENSCRPAVDVLFRSVASAYGNSVLGVVMTGMGQDGLRGCEALRDRRAQVYTQDEATSVVWGMPGAVAKAGLANKVLPIDQIAEEINRRVRFGR